MTHVSESLAGRLAICELSPFLLHEIDVRDADRLWRVGGYPGGGILQPSRYPEWQSYYTTFNSWRSAISPPGVSRHGRRRRLGCSKCWRRESILPPPHDTASVRRFGRVVKPYPKLTLEFAFGTCHKGATLIAMIAAMAQLIVRKLEDALVGHLRRRAARHGLSMEEEHRRILRDVLLPRHAKRRESIKEYILKMPSVGDDELFERVRTARRSVDFD